MKNHIRTWAIGAIYVLLITSITAYLQYTLIIWRNFGYTTHWAVILLVQPAIYGIIFRILRVESVAILCYGGSFMASLLLYPIYRSNLWAEAPHPLLIFFFGLFVGSVTFLVAGNILNRTMSLIKKMPSANLRETTNSDFRGSDKNDTIEHFVNNRYTLLTAFTLNVISVILGIISIFISRIW